MAVFIDLTLGLTRATVLVFKGIGNGEELGDLTSVRVVRGAARRSRVVVWCSIQGRE